MEHEQQTAEWFAERCGIPSASNFDKIITTSGEPSKSRLKYMYQLAGERIIGIREEGFSNDAMKRGVEMESEARYLYEMLYDVKIEQVGLCFPDEKKLVACSPDGLVGEDGLIEIKCPNLATHVGYIVDKKLPTEYFQQLQGQLFVTGRAWVDFVSYYPGLKPLIIRATRDEKFIKALASELELFCQQLNEIVSQIS